MTLEPFHNDVARWVAVLAPAAQLAERIAGTEFVPAAMRGKPDVVAAAIMYGDEIGIGPMQALAGIHVVDGRPQPSAELMRAMILRAGHTMTVHVLTGEHCRLSGLRAGAPESGRVTVEWTLAMARAAGLAGKQNWQRYPRAMLLARATGDLARLLFPDVVKGLGVVAEDAPAELESWAEHVATEPAPDEQKRPSKRVARKPRAIAPPDVPDVPRPRLASDDTPLPEVVPEAPPEPDATPPWTLPPDPWLDAEPDKPPGMAEPPVAPPLPAKRARPTDTTPRPIGEKTRMALMANFRDIGIDPAKDRDMRMALISALMGRDVESTNNLTNSDALYIFGQIAEIQSGALDFDYNTETGRVTLHPIGPD